MIRTRHLLATSLIFMAIPAFAAEKSTKIELKDAKGAMVGTATLTEKKDGVHVLVDAKGLPPGSLGFHFHEKGDCTAPDFKSAGGHFNPEGKKHGAHDASERHAGDMGNVTVAADGTLKVDLLNKGVSMGKGKNSLLKKDGTALIIHAKADDEKTQPTGDAGDRIACAVIK